MVHGQRHTGFTLLELLIVIAIISLLIGIVVPALSSARQEGRTAVCLSNLRTFGAGFNTYAQTNEEYLCSGQSDARPGMNLPSNITELRYTGMERIGWIADLVNINAALPGFLMCPSNFGRQTQSWGRALALPDGAAHYPPNQFKMLTATQGYNTNYCQSWYMAHTQYDGNTRPVFYSDKMYGSMGPLKTSTLGKADASRVPLLADARSPRDATFNHVAQGYGPTVHETKSVTDGPYWKEEPGGTYVAAGYSHATPYGIQDWDDFGPAHRPRTRNEEDHNYTAGNILFGDGHVATFMDTVDFDNGRIRPGPDGELDSWDLRQKVFDGVLTLGRRSGSVSKLE